MSKELLIFNNSKTFFPRNPNNNSNVLLELIGGNLTDQSGLNNSPSILTDLPTISTESSLGKGSLIFNNQRIQYSAIEDPGIAEYTFDLYLKWSIINASTIFLKQDSSGASKWGLWLQNGSGNDYQFFFRPSNESVYQLNGSYAYTTNTLYHFGISRENTDVDSILRLFINGVKIKELHVTKTTSLYFSGNLFTIGDRIKNASYGNFPFRGSIEGFRYIKNECLYKNIF